MSVIKFSGENVLTYLLGLINAKFKTKVDKVEGKGLSSNDFTTDEKTKLSGIANNANNYTHPSHSAAASGLYKVTVDASGHVSSVAAVTKNDITGLGIPSNDTTYSNATQNKAGLMSAADKQAVDNISATVNAAVANAGHLKREIVAVLPNAANASANTVYMVSKTNANDSNAYDEYMFVNGVPEKIGDSTVDLTGYVKETDFSEFENTEVQAIWDEVFAN